MWPSTPLVMACHRHPAEHACLVVARVIEDHLRLPCDVEHSRCSKGRVPSHPCLSTCSDSKPCKNCMGVQYRGCLPVLRRAVEAGPVMVGADNRICQCTRTQQDAICAIKHQVGHVSSLCTRRTRRLHHGVHLPRRQSWSRQWCRQQ